MSIAGSPLHAGGLDTWPGTTPAALAGQTRLARRPLAQAAQKSSPARTPLAPKKPGVTQPAVDSGPLSGALKPFAFTATATAKKEVSLRCQKVNLFQKKAMELTDVDPPQPPSKPSLNPSESLLAPSKPSRNPSKPLLSPPERSPSHECKPFDQDPPAAATKPQGDKPKEAIAVAASTEQQSAQFKKDIAAAIATAQQAAKVSKDPAAPKFTSSLLQKDAAAVEQQSGKPKRPFAAPRPQSPPPKHPSILPLFVSRKHPPKQSQTPWKSSKGRSTDKKISASSTQRSRTPSTPRDSKHRNIPDSPRPHDVNPGRSRDSRPNRTHASSRSQDFPPTAHRQRQVHLPRQTIKPGDGSRQGSKSGRADRFIAPACHAPPHALPHHPTRPSNAHRVRTPGVPGYTDLNRSLSTKRSTPLLPLSDPPTPAPSSTMLPVFVDKPGAAGKGKGKATEPQQEALPPPPPLPRQGSGSRATPLPPALPRQGSGSQAPSQATSLLPSSQAGATSAQGALPPPPPNPPGRSTLKRKVSASASGTLPAAVGTGLNHDNGAAAPAAKRMKIGAAAAAAATKAATR